MMMMLCDDGVCMCGSMYAAYVYVLQGRAAYWLFSAYRHITAASGLMRSLTSSDCALSLVSSHSTRLPAKVMNF